MRLYGLYIYIYMAYMDYTPLTKWDAHPSTHWLLNIHICAIVKTWVNCSVRKVALSCTVTENQLVDDHFSLEMVIFRSHLVQ